MLAHLTGQMGQYLVPFGNLHFERSIPHTFDYCSINRDHVFFWNGVTSFRTPRMSLRTRAGLRIQPDAQRDARVALKERVDDERSRPISVVNLVCSSDLPSVNPVSLDRSSLIPAILSIDASVASSSGLTSVSAAPSRPARAVLPTRWM